MRGSICYGALLSLFLISSISRFLAAETYDDGYYIDDNNYDDNIHIDSVYANDKIDDELLSELPNTEKDFELETDGSAPCENCDSVDLRNKRSVKKAPKENKEEDGIRFDFFRNNKKIGSGHVSLNELETLLINAG